VRVRRRLLVRFLLKRAARRSASSPKKQAEWRNSWFSSRSLCSSRCTRAAERSAAFGPRTLAGSDGCHPAFMPHSSDRSQRTPAYRPSHDQQHFSRAAEEQHPVTPSCSRPGTQVWTIGLGQQPPHLIERGFHRGAYLPWFVFAGPQTTCQRVACGCRSGQRFSRRCATGNALICGDRSHGAATCLAEAAECLPRTRRRYRH